MFSDFFFLLRKSGIDVSPDQWLTLMEALDKGLAQSDITGFYQLCRAVLLKSEAEFDKFDVAFIEYFNGIRQGFIPQQLLEWLNVSGEALDAPVEDGDIDPDETLTAFEQIMAKQDSKHTGGHHWIGTDGTSPFGNRGYGAGGIRLEGESQRKSAFTVAGERRYRDFREDGALDPRSFQVALRGLRHLSARNEAQKTQLDLDTSIRKTADSAGMLHLVFDRPRKNTVKLLLLMDSGGSMDPYAGLCATLFQAASKSDHWGDLRIYYFHNCVRDSLYTTPRILPAESIATDWVLNNLNSDYRLIIVGDALMDMSELSGGNHPTGLDWLHKLKTHFPRVAWLTPQRTKPQTYNHWGDSYFLLAEEFLMYPLTVAGINGAVKSLIAAR